MQSHLGRAASVRNYLDPVGLWICLGGIFFDIIEFGRPTVNVHVPIS